MKSFFVPTFDLWFWVLFVWALAVPYIWDATHVDTCNDTGRVTFISMSALNHTYTCTLPSGGEAHMERGSK